MSPAQLTALRAIAGAPGWNGGCCARLPTLRWLERNGYITLTIDGNRIHSQATDRGADRAAHYRIDSRGLVLRGSVRMVHGEFEALDGGASPAEARGELQGLPAVAGRHRARVHHRPRRKRPDERGCILKPPAMGSIWITTWSGQEHQSLMRVDGAPVGRSSRGAPIVYVVPCSRFERSGRWSHGFELALEYFGAPDGAGLRLATEGERAAAGLDTMAANDERRPR